jgi:hypothetical protein
MDQICLLMPLLAGRCDDARDFMDEFEHDRRDAHHRSGERVGISREAWFLASGKVEVTLVAYIESDDFARALGELSASRDEFDMWFKRRLRDTTGIDLNSAPGITLPALLSSYVAPDRPVPGAASA